MSVEWHTDEELDEIARQNVQNLITEHWERTYAKAYGLLLSAQELDKEETHFIVKSGFLAVRHLPNPPNRKVFDDIRILAFQALDDGRYWPYNYHIKQLKKWQRENAA